jgi:hypothetical protein
MLRKRALRGFEQLENKVLLACDVAYDGQVLDIACDNDDDTVIASGMDGNLFVEVGGVEEDLGSAADLTDIVIDAGGGDDLVIINVLDVSNSIDVKMGNGADRVFSGLVNVGNDLTIKTGNGMDRVTLSGYTVGNNVDIETGNGDDIVEVVPFGPFGGLTAGNNVSIKTGRGDDNVEVVSFGPFGGLAADNDIIIDGEKGNDTLKGEGLLNAGNELVIQGFEITI